MNTQRCLQSRTNIFPQALVALLMLGAFMVTGGAFTSAFAMEHGQPEMKKEQQVPDVEHPMMKPKMYSKEMRCPNCGMMINMWARTRHSFHHPEGDFITCSIRCMADKAVSSEAEPSTAQVALYLDPDTMVPVEKAVYVIGSTAPGTMTMQSKIAFADKVSAEQFAATYGGEVVDFQGAYLAAKKELAKSRMLIDQKRKKTGKIKEPTETDTCVVCGMYPAKYPQHHNQIWAKDGSTLHFCSTQCMVNFNADPAKYMQEPVQTNMAWVTLYSDNMYESAFGVYYVVGSNVDGPMGKEAIPFKLKNNADEFVAVHGGKIVSFSLLTPELVMDGK
jgi:copper chaperone NosL